MAFIEGVFCKARHFVKNALCRGGVRSACNRPAQKFLPLLCHDLRFLFGHGAPHHIRAPQGIPRDHAADLHHLLLVDNAAVCDIKNFPQLRQRIFHMLRMRAVFKIARNGIHWAGAIQRNRRNNILKVLRLHFFKQLAHACALQLKHPAALPRAEHGIGCTVVKALRRNRKTGHLFGDLALRIGNHGEIPQPEKINFQKPQLCNRIHIKLRNGLLPAERQGHIFIYRPIGNHHSCRMHGGMARHALQLHRRMHKLRRLCIILQKRGKLRLLRRLLQRDTVFVWNSLCNGIHIGIAHAQRPPAIPHNRARRKRSEGDDLRHMLRAVFLRNIGDDLAAALIAKIHIKIGHGHALRIEKALKHQFIPNGIHIRDTD